MCSLRLGGSADRKQIYKTGKYKTPDWKEGKEQAIDRPEHRTFLRRAAGDGIVLLKNEKNLLPLGPKLAKTKTVAFIGPNSNESVAAGGGYFPPLLSLHRH